MRVELQDKLIADFPKLYRPNEDCNQMLVFGFECGDGWYDLIRELSEKLYVSVKAVREEPEIEPYSYRCPYATQVKEKYGKLRFYMSWSTDAMDELIDSYQQQSEYICEKCGRPGSIDYCAKWLSAACGEHR